MRKRRLCDALCDEEPHIDIRYRGINVQLNYHKFEKKKIRVEDYQCLEIYRNEQDSELLCSCWSQYELGKVFSISCDAIDPLVRLFYCNLGRKIGASTYDTYIFGKFVPFGADDLAQFLGLTMPKNPSSEVPEFGEISTLFHDQSDVIILPKYKLKHLKQKYYLIAKVFLKLLSPSHSTEYNDIYLLNLIYKMSKGEEVDLANYIWEKIIAGNKGKSLPFGAIITKFVLNKIKSLEIEKPTDWVDKPVTMQHIASEGLGKHQSGQYKRFERLTASTQGENEAEPVEENEETSGAEEEKEEEEKEEASVGENEETSGAEEETEEKHEEPRCSRRYGTGFCSKKVAPNQSYCQEHMPRCQKHIGKRTCKSPALPNKIYCALHILTGEAGGCTNMEMGKMPEGLHHKSKKKRATRSAARRDA